MYQSNRRVTFAEKQRFTMAKKEKNSIIEICPVRNVVARFGNKWALLVIIILDENGPIRFNQLRKQIPDISTKVLSNTLRILEADGLVKRTVFPEVPVRWSTNLRKRVELLYQWFVLTEWAKQYEADNDP